VDCREQKRNGRCFVNDATKQELETEIERARTAYSRLLERAHWLDADFPHVSHADDYILAWEQRDKFLRLEALLQHMTDPFSRRPYVPVPAEALLPDGSSR
jgi:hypothetical protein